MQYTNNSVVNITNIGTGGAALRCTTTNLACCFSGPPPGTHWYFPNGSQVERDGITYYRTRINPYVSPPGTVFLHRNPGANTTGVFRCDIFDDRGNLQSLFVGIYTATTGESYICTYIEDQFVRARAHDHIVRAIACEHKHIRLRTCKRCSFVRSLNLTFHKFGVTVQYLYSVHV